MSRYGFASGDAATREGALRRGSRAIKRGWKGFTEYRDKGEPDTGWDYNPADSQDDRLDQIIKDRQASCNLGPHTFGKKDMGGGIFNANCSPTATKMLDKLSQGLQQNAVDNAGMTTQKQEDWKSLGLPSAKELSKYVSLPTVPQKLNGAKSMDEAIIQIQDALGIQSGGLREVRTPIGVRRIDAQLLGHIVEKREAARERYANLIIPTLEEPTEIWLGEYDTEQRERFLKFWRDGDKAVLVVISIQQGNVLWNAIPMPIRSVDNQRSGKLLWKKYQ